MPVAVARRDRAGLVGEGGTSTIATGIALLPHGWFDGMSAAAARAIARSTLLAPSLECHDRQGRLRREVPGRRGRVERETGFEPATFSLGS
jgi:hypothetical protein